MGWRRVIIMNPHTDIPSILTAAVATATLMNMSMIRGVGQALRAAAFWQAVLRPRQR